MDDDPPAATARIVSWHAHIYYADAAERATAAWLRERLGERFAVQLGRWHDRPIGPHTGAMYQVAFRVADYASLVPWLMLNRRGLSVLVHPNTLAPRADHLVHALWLGTPLPINAGPLGERIAAEDEDDIVPNTHPALPVE
jgi:DOPA 4,5-dioxygenase